MSHLVVENISKSFGATPVLSDVSLDIQSGELFFILGPSGCGKSTLLRIIAGLEKPDTGVVKLGGVDITAVPPHRRGIGMVFQSYALWPHMSVRRNVGFGLESVRMTRKEREDRIAEVLALVRMEQFAYRYPHELSGGQQQRVALARALAVRPSLLLLDEPLSNLDPRLREEIRSEIKQLQARLGTTMVYVTHDQEDALTLASRVALFRQGAVEQIGTPRELYEDPATAFCAEFLGETNLLPVTYASQQREEIAEFHIAGVSSATRVGARSRVGHQDVKDNLFMSVRPDVVTLHSTDSNGVRGRIVDVTYRGSFIDVRLEIGEGLTLRSRVLSSYNPSRELPFSIGTHINAVWNPEHATIVERR